MAWLTRDTEVLATASRWGEASWASLEGAVVRDGPALVHTLGSGVALDVAWCRRAPDGEWEVRRVATLGPHRVARPCLPAAMVIAAPAGAFERWRLVPGDLLHLQ